ncbi:MAG TPA: hypothetical protein VGR05_07795 [Sphingomicrobium sp.]|nr:hypothetical protein [Sphingomicrobium sp.]
MRSFIAAQPRRPHDERDFPMIVTSAKLAETRIFFTERYVFKTKVPAAAQLVAGLSSAAIGQAASKK